MDENKLNLEDEYNKLGYNKNVNSNYNIRKVNSERKLTTGILKRQKNRNRKTSHFMHKEKITNANTIKWDNETIEQQKDYRKNHPLDKEKLKNAISKYSNPVIDNDDAYMKALNKVNQINANDEIICKIFNDLNEKNTGKKKCMKRNKSCLLIGKFKRKFDLKKFYSITEKEKIFDDNLEEEQKLTLQNTLYNKINKNVDDKNNNPY